jgi:hypothetical protein
MQVMKQREETFKKLESSIASAAKEIAVCQEKNTKLGYVFYGVIV